MKCEKFSKQLDLNDDEKNAQQLDLPNGSDVVMKSKRRSVSAKNITDTTEVPTGIVQSTNTISSIAQRPRRQVKHKFIKSANVNVIEKSTCNASSSEVSDESTLLNSLSPNSKLRLVPMIHRLPMNSTKLNWQGMITDLAEQQPNTVTNIENEIIIPNTIEIEVECQESLNDCKQTNQKTCQLQQNDCSIDFVESNNTNEIHFEAEEEEEEETSAVQESTVLTSGT